MKPGWKKDQYKLALSDTRKNRTHMLVQSLSKAEKHFKKYCYLSLWFIVTVKKGLLSNLKLLKEKFVMEK